MRVECKNKAGNDKVKFELKETLKIIISKINKSKLNAQNYGLVYVQRVRNAFKVALNLKNGLFENNFKQSYSNSLII